MSVLDRYRKHLNICVTGPSAARFLKLGIFFSIPQLIIFFVILFVTQFLYIFEINVALHKYNNLQNQESNQH